MATNITADTKYPELNISFTFDQSMEGKLIISTLFDHALYQVEIVTDTDLDFLEFQDIKKALLSKQFKMVSRNPQILKIKIGYVTFDFQRIEKNTLNTLKQTDPEQKQTIQGLSNKLKEQQQKNAVLEELIKELRKEFDLMTTKMSDLRKTNDECKEQIKRSQNEWKVKMEEERLKRVKLQERDGILKERVETLEKERVKQLESEKSCKLQQERVQKLHEHNIKQLEERLSKMIKTANTEDKKVQIIQQEKPKTIQQQDDMLQQETNSDQIKQLIEERRLQQLEQNRLKEQKKRANKQQDDKLMKSEEDNHKIVQQQQNLLKTNQPELKPLHLEKQKPQHIESPQKPSTSTLNFHFSPLQKHSKIHLKNNKTKATAQSGWQGMALVDGPVLQKRSSIRFQISSIDGEIAVGLMIKKVVERNLYLIKDGYWIRHGCYIISDQGRLFSNQDKEHFYTYTDFRYYIGDVIKVKINDGDLLWMNESKKTQFKIKLNLSNDQLTQASFGVYLITKPLSLSPTSAQILS